MLHSRLLPDPRPLRSRSQAMDGRDDLEVMLMMTQGGQGQAQGLGQQAAPATAGTAPGADLAMYRQLAMLLMQMAQAQQQAGHQQQAQTLHSIAVSLSQGQLPPGISLQQLQQLVLVALVVT
ncbi:hypothetical protein HaLaN_09502, partial [Haematococcus lacustris]